eukprot:1595002-Rhodomonas_salina.1
MAVGLLKKAVSLLTMAAGLLTMAGAMLRPCRHRLLMRLRVTGGGGIKLALMLAPLALTRG